MVSINRHKFHKESGVTLLELLVVLSIMAAITLVIGPRVLKYVGKAKTETASVQIENVAAALELYFLETGQYPNQSQGLKALIEQPSGVDGWDGPYLKKETGILDPWGQPFNYIYPGQHGEFDLFTLGSDNQSGGEGNARDVNNWD